MENKTEVSPSVIWNACKSILAQEKRPLELWRVASATGLSEEKIMSILIRETENKREAVTFRFPSLPCAAITAMGAPV